MSKIKIETVTPVHIGSGNLLQNNTDFIVVKEGDDHFIHTVDERKILDLIGVEHLDNWLLSIEKKESTKALISRFAPKSVVEDYSRHKITCCATNIKAQETLKEVIRNGMGFPYIPGSSIKGAIRTAVTSFFASSVKDKEQKIRQGRSIKAENIEKELFGVNPNSDVFRFIRVGDAYYSAESTIATRMINLNIRHKDDLYDESKPQLIEAIGMFEEGGFRMNIAKEYYGWAKEKFPSLGKLRQEMESVPSLFKLINIHTCQLVEKEIEYWKEIDKTGSDIYVEIMEEIRDLIKNCSEGTSCVLRIGHASGWRFITGAWAEELDIFDPHVINASRPGSHRYKGYDFPKTRRIDQDSEVLGFVKLTLVDE